MLAIPFPELEPPWQIPVYVPRSHTNLHAFTLASLAFPPSPHPLIYNSKTLPFPRSSNLSSRLPRLPTFRAHLAKTRLLDRLEAQDLTPAENESILPFGSRELEDLLPKAPEITSTGEELKQIINNNPGISIGLNAWARRLPFTERVCIWTIDTSHNLFDIDADILKREAVALSRPFQREMQISIGNKALADPVNARLVAIRPNEQEPPQLPPQAVVLPKGSPTLTLCSITPLIHETPVMDESMFLDDSQSTSTLTLTTVVVPSAAISETITSPRPLPIPPTRSNADLPEGNGWHALHNPRLSKALTIDSIYEIDHDGTVHCIRFSRDGKYLATGSQRRAEIFNASTGGKIVQFKFANNKGDVYSVCFSPNGKYLATGNEDGKIRVTLISFGYCL
ncbi:hypothetical protein CPB86DRAFT_458506 [Serendipita vermifera]|nr:hypothetical protein CPB86DRAFT_458506 [Serendipita vermifera]